MKSRNKHILTQAVAKLPQHKAPENVWERIEQTLDKEKGLPHLDHAIAQYKAKVDQANLPWEKIEQALENQQILNQAIQSLPDYKLNKDIFEDIIEKTQKKETHNTHSQLYWITSIAASIILLLIFLWRNDPPTGVEKIQITYREEAISQIDWQAIYSQFSNEDEVLQFIRENCDGFADQCQGPGFKGLLEEYMQLQAAREELISQLKTHREQIQLATYLVRIEKEKTEVGKKLIQHLL